MSLQSIVAHIAEVNDAVVKDPAAPNLDPRQSQPSADLNRRRETFTDRAGRGTPLGPIGRDPPRRRRAEGESGVGSKGGVSSSAAPGGRATPPSPPAIPHRPAWPLSASLRLDFKRLRCVLLGV
jgi:hypothetical protein